MQYTLPNNRCAFYCWTHSGVTSDTDKETQLTGIYDLVAVLTHKGRSADSGHYVAWVKQTSGRFLAALYSTSANYIFFFILAVKLTCRYPSQGNGLNMMMIILFLNGRKTSLNCLEEVSRLLINSCTWNKKLFHLWLASTDRQTDKEICITLNSLQPQQPYVHYY